MNKQLLAALLVIPAVLSAGQVLANPYLNGTQVNGLSAPAPDFRLNGTQIMVCRFRVHSCKARRSTAC